PHTLPPPEHHTLSLHDALPILASPADGLEIKRDGNAVTRAEWGVPIPVDPGAHAYEVTAPGKKPWSTTIHVAADASTTTLSVPADRKSTRLNSSHVAISYAVFC